MRLILALLIAAGILFAGCAGYGSPPSASPGTGSGGAAPVATPPSTGSGGAPSEVPPAPPASVGGVQQPPPPQNAPQAKEFTVEASQWTFSPSTITVNQGDKVKITLVSKDVSHGFALPDFGFSLKAGAGETASGEFTAGKPGTYVFFCNVPCGEGHRDMKGTLVVK